MLRSVVSAHIIIYMTYAYCKIYYILIHDSSSSSLGNIAVTIDSIFDCPEVILQSVLLTLLNIYQPKSETS